MRYKVIAASLLAATLSAFAMTQHAAAQTTQQPAKSPARRTIFVPAMGGLEKYIVSALGTEEVPIEVVMEQPTSDLHVRPTFSNSQPPMEVVLYRKVTGHDPFSFLDVVEVKTNRVLFTYRFIWLDDEEHKTYEAREFAKELRKKLSAK
jgi:hypothetical protein